MQQKKLSFIQCEQKSILNYGKIIVICATYYLSRSRIEFCIKKELPSAQIYFVDVNEKMGSFQDFSAYHYFLEHNNIEISGSDRILFCNDTLFFKYRKYYFLKEIARELDFFSGFEVPVLVGEVQEYNKAQSAIKGVVVNKYVSTFAFGTNKLGVFAINSILSSFHFGGALNEVLPFSGCARYIASLNKRYKSKCSDALNNKANAIVIERMISLKFYLEGIVVDVHPSKFQRIKSVIVHRLLLYRDKYFTLHNRS